jgi:hypothetical protein
VPPISRMIPLIEPVQSCAVTGGPKPHNRKRKKVSLITAYCNKVANIAKKQKRQH